MELKACPFCGGEARIESNRDWHHLYVTHKGDCVLDEDNAVTSVDATGDGFSWLVSSWNTRARADMADERIAQLVSAIDDALSCDMSEEARRILHAVIPEQADE